MNPGYERPHADTEYAESQRFVITSRLPRLAAIAAATVGVTAWALFFQRGLILSHYDAKAHLVVARRVIDNITPGWQQIGAVWLPLPHLMQALPTQIDLFYRTGAFGSLLSVGAFTVMVWAAARLVLAMTGSQTGALVAAVLLIVNPNLLYLQSTPMTEPLLLAAVFLVTLWLYEWLSLDQVSFRSGAIDPRQDRGAVPAKLGWALFAAAWTRYEAWLIIGAALAATALCLLRRGGDPRRTLRLIARLAVWPTVAIMIFSLNSRITTGRWLVTGGFYEIDPTYDGLILKSLIAVWWGTHRLSGYVVESAGLAVTAWLIVRATRDRRLSTGLLPLALFAAAVLPFYAFFEAHPFRVRYMIPLASACALFCGVGVGWIRHHTLGVVAAVALVGASLIESPPWNAAAAMIQEAQWDVPRMAERNIVTDCLRADYHDEKIMASMGSLAHYMQELSAAGFRIADFVHEGNGDLWTFALETGPAPHAGWMLVEEQSEGGDVLARKVREDAAFTKGMVRVCAGGGVALYRRQ